MLSTILQLLGFAALIASATLLGILLGGVLSALACGLAAVGVALVVLGLALTPAPQKRPKR